MQWTQVLDQQHQTKNTQKNIEGREEEGTDNSIRTSEEPLMNH